MDDDIQDGQEPETEIAVVSGQNEGSGAAFGEVILLHPVLVLGEFVVVGTVHVTPIDGTPVIWRSMLNKVSTAGTELGLPNKKVVDEVEGDVSVLITVFSESQDKD